MIPTGSLTDNDPDDPMSSIGSSRLQKAIARNKRKLAAKNRPAPADSVESADSAPPEEEEVQELEHYPDQGMGTVSLFDGGVASAQAIGPSWTGPSRLQGPVFLTSLQEKLTHWWEAFKKLAGWGICIFLLLRLIFAEDGILDFVAMEKVLQARRFSLEDIRKENESLFAEILKIQTDGTYQKQLIKNHLGVIAQDEFLILFAREKRTAPGKKI